MRISRKIVLRAGLAALVTTPLIGLGLSAHATSERTLAIGIKTSDVPGAGTDDELDLLVFTSNGVVCELTDGQLDHPDQDDYERNTYTYFTFDLRGWGNNCPLVGKEVTGVEIFAKSSSPDWTIDYIDTRLDGKFERWDVLDERQNGSHKVNEAQSGPHYLVNNRYGGSGISTPDTWYGLSLVNAGHGQFVVADDGKRHPTTWSYTPFFDGSTDGM